MLGEIVYFGLSIALGLISGFLYLLFSLFFKKLSNRAAAVTAQFFVGAAAVCAFTLITFWANDGQFTFYAAMALVVGFFAANIICMKKTS